ncbi:MAG: peptidylprolyl isomerase [Calditrichaeota bacterium]|nr:peptidylprolyl isomerase [Calditrichota bacterium]
MKYFLSASLILFSLTFCGSVEPGKALEKGTADYELAEKLAKISPVFNPEENKVVATTNQFEVRMADVLDKFRSNFGKQVDELEKQQPERLNKLVAEMTENIAMTRISMIEAKDAGIVVTDQDVDSLVQGQYDHYGSEEKFLNFLATNGVTTAMLRRDIHEYEVMKRYLQRLREKEVEVSEEEIDEAYKEDKTATVRHILLLTQGKSEEEKKQRYEEIQGLLERAKAGEDFTELAKKYSEDPGVKENEGLYADFPRGQMVPEFENAAFTVPVGEFSDIVETTYGYHILKIIDRKKDQRSRDVVKSEIQAQKSKEAVEKIFDDLKKQYELNLVDIS